MFTVEIYIRPDSYGEGGQGWVLDKSNNGTIGWYIRIQDNQGIVANVDCATTDATSTLTTSEFSADGKWHHIVMFFNDAGDRKVYLAVDGNWADSYSLQRTGVDAINSDAGHDMYIGNILSGAKTFDGAIGWVRISDNDRYNAGGGDFTPPRAKPASDGNTVVLYHFDEGSGTTLDNEEGTPAYDAILSNGTWEKTFPLQ
jgi:hypothetical protein